MLHILDEKLDFSLSTLWFIICVYHVCVCDVSMNQTLRKYNFFLHKQFWCLHSKTLEVSLKLSGICWDLLDDVMLLIYEVEGYSNLVEKGRVNDLLLILNKFWNILKEMIWSTPIKRRIGLHNRLIRYRLSLSLFLEFCIAFYSALTIVATVFVFLFIRNMYCISTA